MVWVAVIMLCTGPQSLDCEVMVKPHSYSELDTCIEEVNGRLKYLYENQVMAMGRCVQVAIGDPV